MLFEPETIIAFFFFLSDMKIIVVKCHVDASETVVCQRCKTLGGRLSLAKNVRASELAGLYKIMAYYNNNNESRENRKKTHTRLNPGTSLDLARSRKI